MKSWRRRGPRVLGVLLLLALAVTGCGGTTPRDKAGGGEQVRLTLGSPDSEGTPGTDALKHFAARVADLSGGRITVELHWNVTDDPDPEGDVIRQVRDGRLDLGWVGTRAWDGQGLVGFSALQAPFLISDHGVLNAVMTSDLPDRMLTELDTIGLVGLGLYPDQLRHPFGFRTPFLTLADFSGASLRVPDSQVSDAVIRALGATPEHLNGSAFAEALDKGTVAGAESSVGNVVNGNAGILPTGAFMTMNLTFYPKVQTLFAAADRHSSLSTSSQSILKAAADETLIYLLGKDLEAADVKAFCELGGRLVNASPRDLEEIEHAAEPVTRTLEADGTAAGYIARIRDLKSSSSPAPSTLCPNG
jgi:TRAP-type C4-dicarboxylate transport system substrate-binding protein